MAPHGSRKGHMSVKDKRIKLRPAPESQACTLTEEERSAQVQAAIRAREASRVDCLYGQEAATSFRKGKARALGEESEPEEEDRLPLHGVKISATGIQDDARTKLGEQVTALGGSMSSSLMTTTSILLVPSLGLQDESEENVLARQHLQVTLRDSDKFRTAVRRGILVLSIDWIDDLHQCWLQAEAIDLLESIKLHRVRPLETLKISITGFPKEPESTRNDYLRLLEEQGADTSSRLKLGVSHLVVYATPEIVKAHQETGELEPSSKLKVDWLPKLNGRIAANLAKTPDERGMVLVDDVLTAQRLLRTCRAVWSTWVEDSLAAGYALPEDAYDLSKKNTKLAERQVPLPIDLPAYLATHFRPRTSRASAPQLKRKQPDDDPSVVLADATIVDEGASTREKAIIRRSASATRVRLAPEDLSQLLGSSTSSKPAVLADSTQLHQTAKSVAMKVDSKPHATPSTHLGGVRNGQTIAATPRNPNLPSLMSTLAKPEAAPRPARQIFAGYRFQHCGLAGISCTRFVECVIEHGGTFVEEDDMATPDWIVVPFANPPESIDLSDTRVVSQYWVERCLYIGSISNPDAHHMSRAVRFALPIAGADLIHCTGSGLDELDRALLKRLGRLFGLHVTASIEPQTNLVIVPPMVSVLEEGRKVGYAREHGIEIAGFDRLIRLARASPSGLTEPPATTESVQVDALPPLHGCVITTSQRFEHQAESMRSIAQKLGGLFVRTMTDSVTHLIHCSTQTGMVLPEWQPLLDRGGFIVHPKWLEDSLAESTRKVERDYPQSYSVSRLIARAGSAPVLPCSAALAKRLTNSAQPASASAPSFAVPVPLKAQDDQSQSPDDRQRSPLSQIDQTSNADTGARRLSQSHTECQLRTPSRANQENEGVQLTADTSAPVTETVMANQIFSKIYENGLPTSASRKVDRRKVRPTSRPADPSAPTTGQRRRPFEISQVQPYNDAVNHETQEQSVVFGWGASSGSRARLQGVQEGVSEHSQRQTRQR